MIRLIYTVLLVLCLTSSVVFADLLVQAPTSANAGDPVTVEYVSSHTLPPDGVFHKVVVTVNDHVLAQGLDAAGSLVLRFPDPGSIRFEIKAYGVDGELLDEVVRSISVFGIAMTEPVDQSLVGLGSSLYLGASAVFADRWVDAVTFESRRAGDTAYRTIGGSQDATEPYSFLYTPPSSGLWQIRARARHPDVADSVSEPITLQVVSSEPVAPSSVTILDPTGGTSVQAGVRQSVHVDVSSRTGVVKGVALFVDGERVETAEEMDVTFPFRFEWTPLRPGPYTLVAIVTDNRGMRWASPPVEVMASDDRPHAEFQLPRNGATFPAGSEILMMALAVGQGGARERVGEVEFRVNGNVVALAESGQEGKLPFTGRWTPHVPGTYRLQVRVVDEVTGASFQSDAIEVKVSEASPPAVSMLDPLQGSVFQAGDRVRLRATAVTGQGVVEKVTFQVNQVDVGTGAAIAGFYELDYAFEAAGLYHIQARVQSSSGQVVESIPVSVTVTSARGQRPSVDWAQPKSGESYRTGETIQLIASATDSDGNVRQVEFWANRQPIGEPVTRYPFVVDAYRFESAGQYRFSAVATDDQGNRSQRADVVVQVQDPAWQRPTISVRHPVDQAIFEVGDTLYIDADARDGDGVVQQVRFEINGVQHGEVDVTFPFQSAFFTIPAPGIYRIAASAVDDQGYLSHPATLTVYAVPAEEIEGPQFDPLGKDRDFLTQLYLDLFLRGPTDSELNRFLEPLAFGSVDRPDVVLELASSAEFQNLFHSHNAYQAILGEWPTPQGFAQALRREQPDPESHANINPRAAGPDFQRALVLASEGETVSGVLDQVGARHYYAFQLQEDALITLFSSGPTDTVGTLFDESHSIVERDDDSGSFFNFAMQRLLPPGTYYLSVAAWGGQLGSYTLHFRIGENMDLPLSSELGDSDLEATIASLYASEGYQHRFGPLPALDTDTQRRQLVRQLFQHRFGREPSLQQSVQGSNRLVTSADVAAFTAAFIRNDRIGMQDYLYEMPDVSSRDEAAFLIRAFLKQQPDAATIEPLEGLDLRGKVEALLASTAYRERFLLQQEVQTLRNTYRLEDTREVPEWPQSSSHLVSEEGDPVRSENPFHHLPTNEAGWKYVDWLGWISDAHYPMLFHSQLGWIQVHPQQPDVLWAWHERLDWSYFAAGIFPKVYRYSDQRWLELLPGERPGDFEIRVLDPTPESE